MCQTKSIGNERATRGRKSSFVGLLSLIVPELSGGLIPMFTFGMISVTVRFVSPEDFFCYMVAKKKSTWYWVERCLFIRDDVFMVSLVMVKRCLFIEATKKCEKYSVSSFLKLLTNRLLTSDGYSWSCNCYLI